MPNSGDVQREPAGRCVHGHEQERWYRFFQRPSGSGSEQMLLCPTCLMDSQFGR